MSSRYGPRAQAHQAAVNRILNPVAACVAALKGQTTMNGSTYDLIERDDTLGVIYHLLRDAGYVIHDERETRHEVWVEACPAGMSLRTFGSCPARYWFTWGTKGMASYETGEYWPEERQAASEALVHWFANAQIPMADAPIPVPIVTPLAPLDRTDEGYFVFEHNGVEIKDPTRSECGRFPASPDYYGFQIDSTGGGCTAWVREFSYLDRPVTMVITDDASHKLGPVCDVGVYGCAADEWLGGEYPWSVVWTLTSGAEEPIALDSMHVEGEVPLG